MTFTAAMATPPPNLSLKARLAWKYFFENGWAVVHTGDGSYIVTDEALELENATIFPDCYCSHSLSQNCSIGLT